MKLTMKKGLLSIGTIAAIASPITAVISCGSAEHNTINWSDDDTYAGIKGKEFLTEIKHLGKTNQNSITVAREQMMQLQYESESIKSLKAQEDKFKYEAWKNEKIDTVKLNDDLKKAEEEKGNLEGTKKDENNKDVPNGVIADVKTQSVYDDYVAQIKSLNDSIKAKADDLKTLNDKIAILKTALTFPAPTGTGTVQVTINDSFIASTDATKAFFKDTYKSTDYPQVYKPLDTIRSEKTDLVNDAYRQFYPQFTTRQDGDQEWPSELAAQYGGAATFAQAIDYLVTQEISSKAFTAYKFEINKSFTIEQLIWAKNIDKDSFTFLQKASYNTEKYNNDLGLIGSEYEDTTGTVVAGKTEAEIEANIIKIIKGETLGAGAAEKTVASSLLSENVMFLGTQTPNHEVPAGAFDNIANLVKYQHLLITAIQGATPDDVWSIKSDALTKLVSYVNVGGTATFGANLLSNANLFTDPTTTDYILKAISGNSAGTLKIQGSLGAKTELEYLKTMVSGFSLGALAITEGTKTALTTPGTKLPTLNLSALATKLKTEIEKQVALLHTDISAVAAGDINKVNAEIADTIKTLGDDKVSSIFGRIFKDFFQAAAAAATGGTYNGQPLVYSTTITGQYVVVSKFGFHIIKRSSYTKGDDVKQALDDDIAAMAKNSELTSSTNIVDELNSAYSDTKVMEELIKVPTGSTSTPFVDALKTKLDEYNKNKVDEVDQVKFDGIQKLIDQINATSIKTKIDDALGDKLENWLTTQADAGLRDMSSLTLDQIYGWVKLAGGDK